MTNPLDEQQVLRDLIDTEDTVLAGVSSLDDDDAQLLVEHVMNTDHWAGYTRKIVAKENDNEAGNKKASPANHKDMLVEKKAKKTKKKEPEVKEIPAAKAKKDKKGIVKKQKVQALKEAAVVAAANALAEAAAAKAKAMEDRKLRAERRLLA